MPTVHHTVEINKPPSVLFSMLLDANNVKEWAPVVTSSYCSEQLTIRNWSGNRQKAL